MTKQPDSQQDPDVQTEAVAIEPRTGTGFWNVVQSVGAALIGVQSRKNRERDFTHGKPVHFIVGGILGTLLFMLAVWLLVQYLLATS
ncbi:MAG: DUF2970 domain-containing protein [Granulosicoccus sp.]